MLTHRPGPTDRSNETNFGPPRMPALPASAQTPSPAEKVVMRGEAERTLRRNSADAGLAGVGRKRSCPAGSRHGRNAAGLPGVMMPALPTSAEDALVRREVVMR